VAAEQARVRLAGGSAVEVSAGVALGQGQVGKAVRMGEVG